MHFQMMAICLVLTGIIKRYVSHFNFFFCLLFSFFTFYVGKPSNISRLSLDI